jgi:hypothetical protein
VLLRSRCCDKSAAMQIRAAPSRLIVLSVLLGVIPSVFGSADGRPVIESSLYRTSVTSQQLGCTAIKTDTGILLVWNGANLHFTLSVKGQDIHPMENPNNVFVVVDGVVFQLQAVPIKNFAPDAATSKLDNRSILLAHRDWESQYIGDEVLRSKLTVQTASEKLANGAEVLLWQFDLPEKFKTKDAKTQMYLSMTANDHVVLLNGVVSATGSEEAVRNLLLDTIKTFKLSQGPIDVDKLREAIKKGIIP